jgi:hypothetical protein
MESILILSHPSHPSILVVGVLSSVLGSYKCVNDGRQKDTME